MHIAAQVEALVGFDTYPHVDCYERGLEAIKLMHSPNLFSYDYKKLRRPIFPLDQGTGFA